MKRILGIAVVLGLVGALTVMAQEVKPGKVEVIDLGKDVKLEMVFIPAGKFKMGHTKKELEVLNEELMKVFPKRIQDLIEELIASQGKQHEVILTKPYYIGRCEVTQEQWQAVMGNNPSIKTKGPRLPVTGVTWFDCQEFAKKLNGKTNGGYRLPTEAEWEYACRAGTATPYSFGDNITRKDANYGDGEEGTIKLGGSYKPNLFGLYDMHGNVWEWCADWFGAYSEGAVTDPMGPGAGEYRVVRGGGFNETVSGCRSSFRFDLGAPTNRTSHLGFRLARTP